MVDGSVFVPLVDGVVFQLREMPDGTLEDGLSVASMELLGGTDAERLSKVRSTFPKKLNKSQRFAELTVTRAVDAVREKFTNNPNVQRLCNLSLVHTPVVIEERGINFPTHCEVRGLPLITDAYSALVGEAVSYAVTALHPALDPA